MRHHIAWLDTVRALAILLVLISHGRAFLLEVAPWTATLKLGGFLGVELFFVLSGFLIGGILLQLSAELNWQSLHQFFTRRWRRTLPNYFLFVLLNLALALLMIRPAPLNDLWRYLLFVQNLFAAQPPFFPEAWSLSIEELFYLGFPLLGALLAWGLHRPATGVLWALGLGILVLSTGARLWVATEPGLSWDEDLRKVAWLRMDALMVGVLAAFYRGRGGRLLERRAVRWGLLLLFGASALYAGTASYAELDGSYFAKTLLFNTTSLGCLGLILIGLERRLPAWVAAPSGFIARISFSCYLVNLPVVALLERYGPASPWQRWGLFFVLTMGLSWLVYRLWERRFMRPRERRQRVQRLVKGCPSGEPR
ncbi:MAG: acyltransferase [Chromatiaceae bacterium]|nr:acyltransferase [Chromatiaceae bacterium]